MATPLDRVLLRLDHAVLDRWAIPVIPLQIGERASRVLLAVLTAAGLLALLIAPARARLPERVVWVPGAGWADAAEVPGLPAGVADGARLELRVVGGAARGEAVVAAPASTAEPGAVAAPGSALAAGGRVSLNHASAAELESLPGVGPALAARIAAGRPYARVEELDRVKGIGGKTLAKLRPLVEP